jgi:hypothetical protein
MDEPESLGESVWQFLMIIIHFLEHAFDPFGKTAYAGVVLSSYDYGHAAKETKILLEDAGGTIAFLHGCYNLHELIGVIFVSSFSTFGCWVLLQLFNLNPQSKVEYLSFDTRHLLPFGMYVQDTEVVSILCFLISLVVAYSHFVVYGLAMDVMLFAVAFCRKLSLKVSVNNPPARAANKNKAANEVCCPLILKGILKSELGSNMDELGVLADVRAHHHIINHHQFHHAMKTGLNTVSQHATVRFQSQTPLMSTSRYGDR